jgi:hypothetical protein
MANTRSTVVILGAVMMTSCTAAPYNRAPGQGAQRELAEALQGRTPGAPVDCIRNFPTTQMHIIDDSTILFQEGGTVYLQRPVVGCNGIASGANTLVTKPFGVNQLCRGDINQLVNLSSGVQGGACVFSEFVPYTRR